MANPKTMHFTSCGVAVEKNTLTAANAGGVGNIDPTTGRCTKDAVGASPALVFKNLEMQNEGLGNVWGEATVDLRENETRKGAGLPIPEASSMRDCTTGILFQHRSGEFSIEFKMRGLGNASSYAKNADMPNVQVLRSGMAYEENANVSDTLIAGSTETVLKASVGGGANYGLGQMIGVSLNGRREVAWVTKIDTDDVTISPGFSVAPPLNTVIKFSDNLYLADDLSVGDSVCLRLANLDAITYAYGCRVKSVQFKINQAQVSVVAVIKALHIEEDRSAAAPTRTDYANGHLPHFKGSFATYTDAHNGAAAPFALTGTKLKVDRETIVLNVENTLAEGGSSGTIMDADNSEVANQVATAVFTLGTPETVLDQMLWAGESRMFAFGFGPCGQGNGLGIQVGAANTVQDNSKRTPESDLLRQTMSLRAGEYFGDEGASPMANTPFRIGLIAG